MKKKWYFVLTLIFAGAAMLQGCASQRNSETGPSSGETALGTVVPGASQIQAGKSRLEDDYYEFVNQERLARAKIPVDSNNWGYFYQLSNDAFEEVDTLLQQAVENRQQFEEGSLYQKIGDLYMTALDMDTREERGFGSLEPYLDGIRKASDISEYLTALGNLRDDLGLGSLILVTYDVDMRDSSKYACYLSAGDLGLGKETLEDEKRFSELHEKYRKYISTMLIKAGMATADTAEESAREVFSMMRDLASSALPLADAGNPSLTYNRYTKEELCRLLPASAMDQFMAGAGDWENYIVMQPEYLKKISGYLNKEHLELLKNYSVFCLMNDMGLYLSKDIRDEVLRFGQGRSGVQSIKTDEKLASELTQDLLGFETGRLFVEKYFSKQSKKAVEVMVRQILDAYKDKIDALEWMSQKTKEKAKKKLEYMDIKVGYPDRWPDYNEKAQILAPEKGGVLIDNVLELRRSYRQYEDQLVKGPVDRSIWHMTPQTVNAYYNPLSNEIVFPAAILRAPFYDPEASKAENLGGIGMVIAHEITHAFDNSGSQYDEKGNYQVWWTVDDYSNFERRTQAVAEYYNKYEGFDGIYVNGEQTLGENIADLGAVSCVMQIVGDDREALKKLCARYAQIWASKYTDESMRLRLNTDVHSPARVRVNAVLSSMEGFYQAYPEIGEGDGMYVEPEKRVKVW